MRSTKRLFFSLLGIFSCFFLFFINSYKQEWIIMNDPKSSDSRYRTTSIRNLSMDIVTDGADNFTNDNSSGVNSSQSVHTTPRILLNRSKNDAGYKPKYHNIRTNASKPDFVIVSRVTSFEVPTTDIPRSQQLWRNATVVQAYTKRFRDYFASHANGTNDYVTLDIPNYPMEMNSKRGRPKSPRVPGQGPTVFLPTSDSNSAAIIEQLVIAETNGSFYPYQSFNKRELLKIDNLQYHSQYKNPCWHEQRSKRSYLKCMPYFFIAGFTKCGTSELFETLKLHHQVSPSNTKEPFWWPRQFYAKQGPSYYAEYFSQAAFDIWSTIRQSTTHPEEWTHPIVTYEATPDLIYDGTYLQRPPGQPNDEPLSVLLHNVKAVLPKAKIIAVMRNPVDRVFSDYMFFTKTSLVDFHQTSVAAINEFRTCLNTSTERACAYRPVSSLHQKRLRTGLYYIFMKDLLNIFPHEQIFYLRLEDYKKEKLSWLRDIVSFLDLDPATTKEEDKMLENSNPNGQKYIFGQMKNETRKLWEDFYAPFNEKLADLLGNKDYLWR